MALTHLPVLAAILAVEDLGVRFYALTGACISLVAAIEHDLFDLYMDATGLTPEQAAPIFYKHVRFSHKRDTADQAIRESLGKSSLLAKWDVLLRHVQELAGSAAARNLLGHNSVSQQLHVVLRKDAADVYEQFLVNQNANMVLAGMRDPQQVTLETLEIYAQRLITLRLRLTRFAAPLRKACGRPLDKDERLLAARRLRGRTRR
jgi:hypothetical protein